jgi:hypothetical protein
MTKCKGENKNFPVLKNPKAFQGEGRTLGSAEGNRVKRAISYK